MINIIIKDNRQRIIFFTLCLISFLFTQLADSVMSGLTERIDQQSILLFRGENDLNDPIGPKWVEELMRDITALGGTAVLVIISLLTVIYLVLQKYKRLAIVFAITVITAITVSSCLKYGFTRPRPEIIAHASYVYTSSFPSGHTFMSTLIYSVIAGMLCHLCFSRTVKFFFCLVAVLLSLFIGLSRIYLGVHFITDVIGGWILGAGWALLSYFCCRYLKYTRWLP